MFESLGARQAPAGSVSRPPHPERERCTGRHQLRNRAALAMFAPALGAAPSVCRRAGALRTWNTAASGQARTRTAFVTVTVHAWVVRQEWTMPGNDIACMEKPKHRAVNDVAQLLRVVRRKVTVKGSGGVVVTTHRGKV